MEGVNWKIKVGKKGNVDEIFEVLFYVLKFAKCDFFKSVNELQDRINFWKQISTVDDIYEILHLTANLTNRIIILFSLTGNCRKFIPIKRQKGKYIILCVDEKKIAFG